MLGHASGISERAGWVLRFGLKSGSGVSLQPRNIAKNEIRRYASGSNADASLLMTQSFTHSLLLI